MRLVEVEGNIHHSFISIVVVGGGNWEGDRLQCGAEAAEAMIA